MLLAPPMDKRTVIGVYMRVLQLPQPALVPRAPGRISYYTRVMLHHACMCCGVKTDSAGAATSAPTACSERGPGIAPAGLTRSTQCVRTHVCNYKCKCKCKCK